MLRRSVALGKSVVMVFLLGQVPAALAQHEYTLPLVMSGSNAAQQGFVRIINRSDRAGTVRIRAIDDSGRRFPPVSLSIDAMETVHFNSQDLEEGNTSKGLSGSVGDGHGDWRLELGTDLDIEPLAFVRTSDGFVTSVHGVVDEGPMRWQRAHIQSGEQRLATEQAPLDQFRGGRSRGDDHRAR